MQTKLRWSRIAAFPNIRQGDVIPFTQQQLTIGVSRFLNQDASHHRELLQLLILYK